jgi:hypothetical protein
MAKSQTINGKATPGMGESQSSGIMKGRSMNVMYNEYQLMPYIDADKKQFTEKEIKRIFKHKYTF